MPCVRRADSGHDHVSHASYASRAGQRTGEDAKVAKQKNRPGKSKRTAAQPNHNPSTQKPTSGTQHMRGAMKQIVEYKNDPSTVAPAG